MEKFVALKNDVIVNVIVADQAFIDSPEGQALIGPEIDSFININALKEVNGEKPWIGWTRDPKTDEYTKPPPPPPEPTIGDVSLEIDQKLAELMKTDSDKIIADVEAKYGFLPGALTALPKDAQNVLIATELGYTLKSE